MRVFLSGTTIEGDAVERGVLLPLGAPAASATRRLTDSGVGTVISDTGFTITRVEFGSQAAKLGIQSGFRIDAVEVPSDRPAQEWMFLPALALIGWVVRQQKRRRAALADVATEAPAA